MSPCNPWRGGCTAALAAHCMDRRRLLFLSSDSPSLPYLRVGPTAVPLQCPQHHLCLYAKVKQQIQSFLLIRAHGVFTCVNRMTANVWTYIRERML